MSLLDSARTQALALATAGCALQRVLFDRDETDSYRIRMEQVDEKAEQLTRAQLMTALPTGSRWADALGWESYVVYPAADLGVSRPVALVALEQVVAHDSRGAYPQFAGVLVPVPSVEGVLRSIAARLDPGGAPQGATVYGVVTFPSTSPEEHRPAAAWLLRAAATSFRSGHPLRVRTALLTEDQVPRARTLLSPQSILFGTAPPLRARFSWLADKMLRGLEEL